MTGLERSKVVELLLLVAQKLVELLFPCSLARKRNSTTIPCLFYRNKDYVVHVSGPDGSTECEKKWEKKCWPTQNRIS